MAEIHSAIDYEVFTGKTTDAYQVFNLSGNPQYMIIEQSTRDAVIGFQVGGHFGGDAFVAIGENYYTIICPAIRIKAQTPGNYGDFQIEVYY